MAELSGLWYRRGSRANDRNTPEKRAAAPVQVVDETCNHYTWPDMHRCVNLLQLQQELIDSLYEQIVELRAERDVARKIQHDIEVIKRSIVRLTPDIT
jgi:hypothetical protein